MDPLSIEDFERQFLADEKDTPEVEQTREVMKSGPTTLEDFERSFLSTDPQDDDDQTNYGLDGPLKKSDLKKGQNVKDISD